VVRQTGLSPHVIRVWERRYQAVSPGRTTTNRRRYSASEVERLMLLKAATHAGHSIGTVAGLTNDQLKALGGGVSVAPASASMDGARATAVVMRPPQAEAFLDESLRAGRGLDSPGLDRALDQALVALGHRGLLTLVIAPLIQLIGEQWKAGILTAAHEHFASAVIRVFLSHVSRPFLASENSPVLVVSTPSGQIHELGAVLVGSAASSLGWWVVYLGPSLPASEIAGAALQRGARAVALSVVYPEDDTALPGEVDRLRRLLPASTALLVGGRAAASYAGAFSETGITLIRALEDFGEALDRLRRGPGMAAGTGDVGPANRV